MTNEHKIDLTKILYVLIMILVFTMATAFGQGSYVVLEAQYDSYGPAESQFHITDA